MLVTALSSATAATATDGPTTLRVRGTQTQVDENLFKSYGGLLGDFWILTFVPLYESDSLVIGTGTERFVGCVDVNRNKKCESREPSGELRFDYTEWMTFDPSTGALIEANCVHPITGGSRSFTGARGIVMMRGVMVNRDFRVTYQGTVVLNAVPAQAQVAPQAPAVYAPTALATSARPAHC